MKRTATYLIVILLLTTTTLLFSINNTSISAQPLQKTVNRTLYVGGAGPNNYTSIQNAVNNSLDGDMIFVYTGTYSENIDVNKELIIEGEQENTTTTLQFTINSDNVTIKKFSFYESWGVMSHGFNFTITQCTFKGPSGGSIMSYGSKFTIDNCTFKGTGGGTAIDIRNDNAVVENCTITGAYWRGIDCADYWLYGIYPKSNITIQRCLIENTWQHPWDNPSYAIGRIGGNGLITECTFVNNSRALYSISNSWIYRNNFVSGGIGNVYDNLWNSTYPVCGNYWKLYTDADNFSGEGQNISGPDGIGDTPHTVIGADPVAYDYYPLIDMYCPWDTTPPEINIINPENNTVMRTGETNVQINIYDTHLRNTSYKINNQDWCTTKENNLFFDTAEWIEDGFYNITINAVDYNNNHATAFYSFVIDNTPPSTPGKPMYENDEPGSNIDRDGKIVFYWTPTVDANLDVYEVWLSINNEPYTLVFDTPYNYTTINGTTGNNYTIAVVAKDKVGLKSTQSPSSDTITVNITIILPEIMIQETDTTTANDTITIHWIIIAGSPTSFEISMDGETWTDIGLNTQRTFMLAIGENILYVRGKTNQYIGDPDSITITRTNNTQVGDNETGKNNETKQGPLTSLIIFSIIIILAIIIIAAIIFYRKRKQGGGNIVCLKQ